MQFDQFNPYKILEEALNFRFITYRYEEWINGKLNREGKLLANIVCIPVFIDDKKSEVTFRNLPKELNIYETLTFDLTFTGKDRIFLSTIPRKTNIENYNAFNVFKNSVPLGFPIITREEREFDDNEPFACSLFLQDDEICKISFSFGNNPRLLEFYNDEILLGNTNKSIAKIIITLLLEDLDEDGASVGENSLINEIREKLGFEPTKEQLSLAIEYINSKYENEIIETEDIDMSFFSSVAYTTEYSEDDLNLILNDLD